MKYLKVYTDGSCIGKPKKGMKHTTTGGWGVYCPKKNIRLKGTEEQTTSQRMELMACIQALSFFKMNFNIEIISDSQYLVKGATTWMYNWFKRKNSKKANMDYWKQIYDLVKEKNVKFTWIKGHSGIEGNEIADKLASEASKMQIKPNFETIKIGKRYFKYTSDWKFNEITRKEYDTLCIIKK